MQVSEKVDKCNYFLKDVGRRLRYYRKEKSLTQKQIAKALSMATISYSLIERGKAGTTLKKLYKIAMILCVSPAQLLLGMDEILLKKSDIAKNYINESG